MHGFEVCINEHQIILLFISIMANKIHDAKKWHWAYEKMVIVWLKSCDKLQWGFHVLYQASYYKIWPPVFIDIKSVIQGSVTKDYWDKSQIQMHFLNKDTCTFS